MKNKFLYLFLVGWAVFPLFLSAAEIGEKDISIETLAVSPRMIQGDQSGFFDRRSPGLFVVGVGEKSFLHGRLPQSIADTATVEWTFAQKPSGSQTQLLPADRRNTAFSPDKEGWYDIQLSVSGSSSPILKNIQILAATYVGVGGMSDTDPTYPECGLCHGGIIDSLEDVITPWRKTRHAQVLARHLNGERSSQYTTRCFECHTTGFDPNLQAPDNGFHTALQKEGVNLQTLADQINDAYQRNHDRDANNNVAYYNSLPASLRAKANVQCENCHGPGSQHLGDAAQIGKAWDARVCAQCHDSQGFDNYPYPYDSSDHKVLPEVFQEFPSLLQTTCAKCHSAEGFVRLAIEGDTAAQPESTDPHAVSCVACHDPHDPALPKQLRWMQDVVLDSGYEFKNAGKGSICALCHQSRVPKNLETFINNDSAGPHYGPQADILLGVNAWSFGADIKQVTSVHQVVTQDACMTCHMARIPQNGWSVEKGTLLGGHSFKITNSLDTDTPSDDISNYRNACQPCHLTMTSIDRVMKTGQDYDGNGKVEGIQTEVRGLLMRIANRLIERYPGIQVDDELELVIPGTIATQFSFTEKAVVYNFRLFVRDGSFGVHNGRYTIQILQKTYAALTQRSLKLDYRNAYLIESSSIPEWSKYKE